MEKTEKNEKIRFSVIMCTYNLEKIVGTAIDSVLEQKFKNYAYFLNILRLRYFLYTCI